MIPTPIKRSEKPGLGLRLQRDLIFRALKGIQRGQLRIHDSTGIHVFGGSADEVVDLQVLRFSFYRRVFWGGGLGAAESLMDGDWTCDDLPGLVRLVTRNLVIADDLERGWGRWRRGWERLQHWMKRNSLGQARKNIREHYDLGNEFFSILLDPTMNYSSAIFSDLGSPGRSESLHRGQLNKMDRLCRTLQLQPKDHLLEIGTGWGAFACYAARHYGCRVTTTTISHEQFESARRRVKQEELQDRVTVLEQDYRALSGVYDKIVSVEMVEAVGDEYFDTFFNKCKQLLKPNGLILLQAITIVDQRYRQHLRNVDFICKYIFPGGSLPCISRLTSSAAQAAEMRLVHLQDFAPHYAETLRRWRQRFQQNLGRIRELGYDERFIRMWDYYLAYCQAGFEERQINLVQMLFAHRDCRLDHGQLSRELQWNESKEVLREEPHDETFPQAQVP